MCAGGTGRGLRAGCGNSFDPDTRVLLAGGGTKAIKDIRVGDHVVASDPTATRWHVVCDNLNTHQSEALVRFVAELSGIQEDLGVKGKSGILLYSQRARLADSKV